MVLRQFVAEVSDGRPARVLPEWWVVLCSTTKGTGKSHLALALTADICRLGVTALYCWEPDMLQMLWDSQGDKAEYGATQLYELWLKPAVLVIDEFAGIRPTEFVARQQYRLVEARLRKGRPTILTTNKPWRDLGDFYAADRDQGERIVSRVKGQCLPDPDTMEPRTWLTMEGPDLRGWR